MNPNPNLRIHQTTRGDIVTLEMTGELDEASCPALADCLAAHCRPGARVVLDLRSLNFLDAAGLEFLHEAYVRSSLEGWTFAVMTPGERFVARRAAA
jgi:anti-anti-sigma factor